jgi:hypothetical protein
MGPGPICEKHGCEKKRRSSGSYRCPRCHAEKARKYYAEHKERLLAKGRDRGRKYRSIAENRERHNEQSKMLYRAEDPEKRRARKRQYYAENRERLRARDRSYRASNPDVYVRRLLTRSSIGLSGELTPKIIQAKRAQVMVQRFLKGKAK